MDSFSYYRDEFNLMARRWEEHAEACERVRYSELGDEHEAIALLNRQKVFERCSKEIRSLMERIEESAKQLENASKSKLPKK